MLFLKLSVPHNCCSCWTVARAEDERFSSLKVTSGCYKVFEMQVGVKEDAANEDDTPMTDDASKDSSLTKKEEVSFIAFTIIFFR